MPLRPCGGLPRVPISRCRRRCRGSCGHPASGLPKPSHGPSPSVPWWPDPVRGREPVRQEGLPTKAHSSCIHHVPCGSVRGPTGCSAMVTGPLRRSTRSPADSPRVRLGVPRQCGFQHLTFLLALRIRPKAYAGERQALGRHSRHPVAGSTKKGFRCTAPGSPWIGIARERHGAKFPPAGGGCVALAE